MKQEKNCFNLKKNDQRDLATRKKREREREEK
jgi:hypothetical protein